MKKTMMLCLMSAMMLMVVSCGTQGDKNDSTETAEDQNEERFENSDLYDDAEFAVEAANGGLMEVQMGTMALTKATSPEVKQFAQMMVDDHTKANNELKALAREKNIELPTVMGNEYQRKFDNLNGKSGADFDKEYMDLMVKDHKEDVGEFEEQAEKGKDPELRSWAAGKVVTLKHHLDIAERTQETLESKQ